MNATQILLIAAVLIAAFSLYAWKRLVKDKGSDSNVLDTVVQNGLIMLTALGALSTIWLTAYNNKTAWLAYRESVRPSALFQVHRGDPEGGEPKSVIKYMNHSRSDVEKLRV